MTSLNPRADIYDPKTLAVMDQAFAAIWTCSGRMIPSATDSVRLRNLTVDSLLVSDH